MCKLIKMKEHNCYNNNMYVLKLEDSASQPVEKIGGKAKSLSELSQNGMKVPPGFVITTDGFSNGMTSELKLSILDSFNELGAEYVAVRSSAIAEDSDKASWAGQLESYLSVDRNGLIDAVKKCWKSIESERSQNYAKDHDIPKDKQKVAVIVQAMVDSKKSGVLFTANPVTNDRSELLIESIFGLGELLVQGEVTPFSAVINSDGSIKTQSKLKQSKQLRIRNGKINEESIDTDLSLEDDLLNELRDAATKIETYFKAPQDIEWAVENNQLFILQSRPITTLSQSVSLPDFIHNCNKVLVRPATVQRDEITCLTSQVIHPVDLISIPLEANNRAYYLESEAVVTIIQKSIAEVDTVEKLHVHLDKYNALVKFTDDFVGDIVNNPTNYLHILDTYIHFQQKLGIFLYAGIAIDSVIFPKFESVIKEKFPANADKILISVTKPARLNEYQKYRFELLDFAMSRKAPTQSELEALAERYRFINEYSFIEPLLSFDAVKLDLNTLTNHEAKQEKRKIEESIDNNPKWEADLAAQITDKDILNQAILIKHYSFLRTDRIDLLKKVQSALRIMFEHIATRILEADQKSWSISDIASLLTVEIREFIEKNVIPDFDNVQVRKSSRYAYVYQDGIAQIITNEDWITVAQSILTRNDSHSGSIISSGLTAFKGIVQGRVVKVLGKEDLVRVKNGDIIVARFTMPDYTPAMQRAAGIITAEGGVTSHAAIVARELKKPCIVGSENCLEIIDDGQKIILDSINQTVTKIES